MKIFLRRLIGLYCCLSLNSYAATFPQKSISYSVGLGTPITTSTAEPLDKGKVSFGERNEYVSNRPISDNLLLQNPFAESQKSALTNFLMIFYGLTNNLTIGVSQQYAFNTGIAAPRFNEVTNMDFISNLGSANGLGDTNLFSMWLLHKEDKRSISLSILAGLNAPTGKTNVRDNNGALFSATDQPGTGAWTPLTGIIISKNYKKFSLSANLIYTQSTEGTQKTTLGLIIILRQL
jgi:hypothetical protein